VATQGDISRLTAGPPDIPADRLAALRAAFKAAMEDKEFLAKTSKMGLPVEPAYGDTVRQMVKDALQQSPETIALLAKALQEQK
jgi:tripartite-type tricarboxylate transporter receptor subunit TctC